MARATIKSTVLTQLPSGPQADAVGAVDQVDNIDTANTNIADVEAAITAALANKTISGDATAKGLVEAIETALDTVSTPLAAAVSGLTGDVLVTFDTDTVTSRDDLRGAFDTMVGYAVASGLVTE